MREIDVELIVSSDVIKGSANDTSSNYAILKWINHPDPSFEGYFTKLVWLINDDNEIKYIKEYKQSESLFNLLDKDKYVVNSKFSESEWEFPKGKKNKNEENYMCAKRELEEETNIREEDYELIKNISPIIENFKGENNINYRNIYYVGICKNTKNIKVDINNRDQLSEIRDVKILTKNEAIDHIRDYNITKIDMINSIYNFIDKYKNDLVFKLK